MARTERKELDDDRHSHRSAGVYYSAPAGVRPCSRAQEKRKQDRKQPFLELCDAEDNGQYPGMAVCSDPGRLAQKHKAGTRAQREFVLEGLT